MENDIQKAIKDIYCEVVVTKWYHRLAYVVYIIWMVLGGAFLGWTLVYEPEMVLIVIAITVLAIGYVFRRIAMYVIYGNQRICFVSRELTEEEGHTRITNMVS